ncbi:CTD small phosphatase-like protein 2 [Diplonema papillatum]|nr:CTD small phosphatase-like protein 2 [Diplonema papillatum]
MPPKSKAKSPSPPPEDVMAVMELKGRQLRGGSFVQEYGKKKNVTLMERLPTMLKGKKHANQLIPQAEEADKLLCVFDLDETIVFARDGPLLLRPKAKELLLALENVTEIAMWTAGVRDYAKAVLVEVEKEVWGKSPAGVVKHLITRNKNWFDVKDYTKDLRQLGRDLSQVLIIENTPDCVRLNPENAIIVEDFEGGADPDAPLIALKQVILDLVESKRPVHEFIPECPMLDKQTIDGTEVYYLTAGKKGKTKDVKENRDKNKKADEDDEDTEPEEDEVPVRKTPKKKPSPKAKPTPKAKASKRKANGAEETPSKKAKK